MIDYLILSTLHSLTKNSIFNLNQCFEEEISTIPTVEDIDGLQIQVALRLHPEEDDEEPEDPNSIAMPTKASQEQTNVNADPGSAVSVRELCSL